MSGARPLPTMMVDALRDLLRRPPPSRPKAGRPAGAADLSWAFGAAAVAAAVLSYGCGEGNRKTLEAFAAELPEASRPGPAARNFVESVGGGSPPDRRLALVYKQLKAAWRYNPDPPGEDHFSSAEAALSSQPPGGDCDDFAAAIVAVCKVVSLPHRVYLGESGGSGHVWVEVLVSRKEALNPDLGRRINEEFGDSARVVSRGDGHWLQLSQKGSLDNLKATHYIDISGRLYPITGGDGQVAER